MPANYVLLERIELNASASSVTFANIPQSGYTDLKVVVSARSSFSAAIEGLAVRFNGDTTSGNYTGKRLYGDGSNANSDSSSYALFMDGATATASTFASIDLYIPNYLSSNSKSYSAEPAQENNTTTAYLGLNAGRWSGTSAISSITFTSENSANFVSGSTFSLYGLAAVGTTPVIAPKASGGNRIDYDGTYWIHTFTTTGAFVPAVGLTCDYLVVAGGGAGGFGAANVGGAGGAGGMRCTVTATGGGGSLESAIAVTSGTSYTITVGAGGAGASSANDGTNGNDSIFSTITATGGGGGAGTSLGSGVARAGKSGGSGGGASYWNGGTASGGAATPSGQGFKGGDITSSVNNNRAGAGGGGAGVAGANVTVNGRGTAGGNGVATSISGTSTTYAGGGGGAGDSPPTGYAGGTGGGGAGAWAGSATSGTTNTGGGGGGMNDTGTSGSGGSGIVIIRYLA